MNYSEKRTYDVPAFVTEFSRTLRAAFLRFADLYIANGRRPMHVREVNFPGVEYSVFAKLARFGLIEPQATIGEWTLTPLGEEFFAGCAQIITPIATLDNEVLSADHPAWSTHNGVRRSVGIHDEIAGYHRAAA